MAGKGRVYGSARSIILHHDHVAEEALGGHTADLGKKYFTSSGFVGTVVVDHVPSNPNCLV